MGLLDRVRLEDGRSAPPRSIDLDDRNDFVIAWEDGKTARVPSLDLRDACPCAGCIDEMTGRKTLDRATLPPDVRPLRVEPVGSYAVQIHWSDGHSTGIYTWETLRRACGA